MRVRYLLRFGLVDDLRFISHRDTMRMFERALLRAKLPVGYTEGFNPRVRLSLPLPRSVGTAAEDEVLIFELTAKLEAGDVLERMRGQSPGGLVVRSVVSIRPGDTPRPVRAYYELDLAAGGTEGERADPVVLAQRIARFDASASWPIQRATKGRRSGTRNRSLDLRKLVERAELTGSVLRMVLSVRQSGSARPAEVLGALGLPADRWSHRLRRTRSDWEPPLPEPSGMSFGPKKGINK